MALLDNPARVVGVGNKNVVTPGTAVQLATTQAASAVAITARPANTGKIAVGSAAVKATVGSELGVVLPAGATVTLNIDDVSKVWIDATVAGEGVSYLYLTT